MAAVHNSLEEHLREAAAASLRHHHPGSDAHLDTTAGYPGQRRHQRAQDSAPGHALFAHPADAVLETHEERFQHTDGALRGLQACAFAIAPSPSVLLF